MQALNTIYYYFKFTLFRRTTIGKGVRISGRLFISRKNTVHLGDNNYIGPNCHIASNLRLSSRILIAPNVAFVGGDHKFENTGGLGIMESGRDVFRTTTVESNCWIGYGSIITHGVTISSGSVIAAGSVLTKSTNANEIWGGNPAKFIRMRNP